LEKRRLERDPADSTSNSLILYDSILRKDSKSK
jgi:hypothetical protein